VRGDDQKEDGVGRAVRRNDTHQRDGAGHAGGGGGGLGRDGDERVVVRGRAVSAAARREQLVADLTLFSVAVVWGFNFVVIKDAIGRIDPMLYVLLRYIAAFVMFAAIAPRSLTRSRRQDWVMGAILGSFYFTALLVQTIGLQYTTPGRSSFITGLDVAMVPFLYWLVARRSPGKSQIAGALVATVGLGVLSLRGGLASGGAVMGWGDALTLLGALFYALHIMTTGFFAPRVAPATLAITQVAASAVFAAIIAPFVTHVTLALPWQAWAAIIWTAVSGTIYAFFVQAWAQRRTTATHAAVLLCFESVFGAVFGILFGMDSITWRLVGGAALIFCGVLIIELLPIGGRPEPETPGSALMPAGERRAAVDS
jgi:drug/metabolite transporter (DMT)-like permease